MKHRGAESTEKDTEKYFTQIEFIARFGYEGVKSSLRELLEKCTVTRRATSKLAS